MIYTHEIKLYDSESYNRSAEAKKWATFLEGCYKEFCNEAKYDLNLYWPNYPGLYNKHNILNYFIVGNQTQIIVFNSEQDYLLFALKYL